MSQLRTNTTHFVRYTDEVIYELIVDYFTIDSLAITNKIKQNKKTKESLKSVNGQRRESKISKDGTWGYCGTKTTLSCLIALLTP